jgi:hypothetical protein
MGMSRSFGSERLFPMKKTAQHLIAEVPGRRSRVETTIGIDLGDVWSHYCTINQDGEIFDRGRFRTIPKVVEKWFTDLPPAGVAMEAGTHSIWISEQLQELGHEVIVAIPLFIDLFDPVKKYIPTIRVISRRCIVSLGLDT